MPVEEYPFEDNLSTEVSDTFGMKDVVILLLVFGGLAVYVWGCIKHGWSYDYMVACMMLTCIPAGFIGGMNANQVAKTFVEGFFALHACHKDHCHSFFAS